jgi:hypothetical protein
MWIDSSIYILIFIPESPNSTEFTEIKKQKTFKMHIVFIKGQVMFWSLEGTGGVSPTALNFCSF